MNIIMKSKFSRSIVSGILNKFLKRKFECDFNLKLKDLNLVEDDDGMVHIQLDVTAKMDKDDLMRLFKEYV